MSTALLVGFGNPLLDISVTADESFLEKYNLKSNDAILADASHAEIYTEILDPAKFPKVDLVAGGACQNTMRGAQWLLPKDSTVYCGCVGKDSNAALLKQAASADGLKTVYLEDESTPTGRCAVLINGVNRSLVTDLQAANNYKITHAQSEEVMVHVQNAKAFYIEGYHLTVSPETILFVAKYAAEHDKTFALNLSAPFISQFFTKPLDDVIPYTDILFGNESEAAAFADAHDFGTHDVKEIALKIAALPMATPGRNRMVVFTQGSQSTIIAQNGSITEFPVIPISVSDIVDTNGAGDAFAGGFMAGFVLGKSVTECVAAGNYVANVVIQRVGPTYPREPPTFTF